jgi:hypothetical protein
MAENGRDETELERHRQWPTSLYYRGISLEGARKTTEPLSKCSRNNCQDSNVALTVIVIILTTRYTQKQNFRPHIRKGKFVRRTHNPEEGNSTESESISGCGC